VLRILIAALLAVAILAVGVLMTRAVSARRIGDDEARPDEPEDVTELDVYFVCRECGTEFQVTRLGEVQVPRHCGEPMEVVQRPRAGPPELN
jgi:hypothetical protein